MLSLQRSIKRDIIADKQLLNWKFIRLSPISIVWQKDLTNRCELGAPFEGGTPCCLLNVKVWLDKARRRRQLTSDPTHIPTFKSQ